MGDRLSRRDLFGMFRKSLSAAKADELPLRPPGAIDEDRIADTCIRCGACIDVCPRRAIRAIPRGYAAGVGTPYIVPREAPCVMCSGLSCTAVCPSGTLRRLTSPHEVHMGRAIIDKARCLPYQGTACSACVSFCPVQGAISLDAQARPHITDACTGCGLCEHYCPPDPTAVHIRPRVPR